MISLLGDLDFVLGYVSPLLRFLDSVWGTFSLVLVGFVLIYKASREPSPEDNAETDSEQQEMERLRSENRQIKIEKSQLEEKLKTETDPTKARLLAIRPTSSSPDMSGVDFSNISNVTPSSRSEPTGMMFFIKGYERLREENQKVKAERDALKSKLGQIKTQESNEADNEGSLIS
jgi:regulator of replication initiation timing